MCSKEHTAHTAAATSTRALSPSFRPSTPQQSRAGVLAQPCARQRRHCPTNMRAALLLVLALLSSLLTTAAASAVVLGNRFGTCGIEPSLEIGLCGAVHVSLDSWELRLNAPGDLQCQFYHDSDCTEVISSGLDPDVWASSSTSTVARTKVCFLSAVAPALAVPVFFFCCCY